MLLMLMNDPLTSGALSRPDGGNPLSWGALSTAVRSLRIPAKIPHYSNDCLGVGKRQTCEIFVTDAVLQMRSGSSTSDVVEGFIRARLVGSATIGVRAS